jgi:VWFA-related protein
VRKVACALVGLVVQVAGPARPAPNQQPVFRAAVDVVQLDVSVLDKNRRPVLGLTSADFTIEEDGKTQPIVAFDAIAIEVPAPVSAEWMRVVSSDVTTNSLAETRLFVIVVDDAGIPADAAIGRAARRIAQDIVARTGPNDLTAVVFTANSRNAQDFTNDRSKLLESVSRPVSSASSDPGAHAISTLARVADYLVAVPHRRKAVIWISPGVSVNFAAAAPARLLAGGGMAGREHALYLADKATDMLRRAQRANVAIYGIDPSGLRSQPAGLDLDFLLIAASHTGGRAVINTNDFAPGIAQIFRENSAYYLLGFRSTNDKPGTFRRIEVKVNRPDVEVHTRTGYYAPVPDKPGIPEPSPLAEAITGILPNPDLPMEVALAPFAIPGDSNATVTIALGVRQPIPIEAATARVTETMALQTSAFSPDGDARGTQRHTANVTLRLGADGDAQYEALSRIDLRPGRYRLRLAAYSESSKRSGSVFADVEIPDFARLPFSMSGVILHAEPGRPAAPKDVLEPFLPFAPTSDREFVATDRVTALVRIYQDGRRAVESARLSIRVQDLQDRLVVDETLVLGTDRFVLVRPSQPATSISSSDAVRLGMRTRLAGNPQLLTAEVQHQLPLDRLGPGPHLLTLEATRGATSVTRHLRFAVK